MSETYQPHEVHYLGTEGSYSEIMARHLFPDESGIIRISQPNFDDITDVLAENRHAAAVLPIENNSSSRVHENSDAIFERQLIVMGVAWLRVYIHLLGIEGAKEEDAKIIYSHVQALKQSSKYRKSRKLVQKRLPSTSEAAAVVADEHNPAIVCLGGLKLAKEAGLVVLKKHVANKGKNNKTKFFVVRGRQGDETPEIPPPNGDDLMVTMVAGLHDRKGSLGHYLVDLAEAGADLRTTASNPDPEDDGEHEDEGDYHFWVDIRAKSQDIERVLEVARQRAHMLDILGIYKPGDTYSSEVEQAA